MNLRALVVFALLAPLGITCVQAGARDSISAVEQAPKTRPAEEVQDNSFLIEEAYNQEAGVVQHILNIVYTTDRRSGPDEHQWSFVFTQEWPAFSQTHQLSYTVSVHVSRLGQQLGEWLRGDQPELPPAGPDGIGEAACLCTALQSDFADR